MFFVEKIWTATLCLKVTFCIIICKDTSLMIFCRLFVANLIVYANYRYNRDPVR